MPNVQVSFKQTLRNSFQTSALQAASKSSNIRPNPEYSTLEVAVTLRKEHRTTFHGTASPTLSIPPDLYCEHRDLESYNAGTTLQVGPCMLNLQKKKQVVTEGPYTQYTFSPPGGRSLPIIFLCVVPNPPLRLNLWAQPACKGLRQKALQLSTYL